MEGTLIKQKVTSEKDYFCERCKYIGWDKRNQLMKERKHMRWLHGRNETESLLSWGPYL